MAWTSWTVSNSTVMDGFQDTFPIEPQNYNSSVVAAIYINGVLDTEEAYTIHPPVLPGQGYQTSLANYSTGFQGRMPPTILSPGTVVSIAILCRDTTHDLREQRWAHLRVTGKFSTSAASIFPEHPPVHAPNVCVQCVAIENHDSKLLLLIMDVA